MNSKNTNTHNFEISQKSQTIALNQLFFKNKTEEIIIDKTRISHKRPEDIISAKNKQNSENTLSFTQKLFWENKKYFEWKLSQEDFAIFYNLLKRRYKKLKQGDIIRTMKFLLDKWIEEYLLIDLGKIVIKSQSFNDLLKSGLWKLFDELTDENFSEKQNNSKLECFIKNLKVNIQKTEDEILEDRFFDEIHIAPSFNSEEELKKILSLKSEEKQEALNIFYKNLKKQLDIISSLPGKIKNLSIKFDNEKVSHWEYSKLVIQYLENEFKILSTKQRIAVIKQISKYIDTKKIINDYGNINDFDNNPKKLMSSILNIPEENIEWWIYFEEELTSLVFYISNPKDFTNIYSSLFNASEAEAEQVGWFFTNSKIVPISLINWSKFFSIRSEIVKDHEIRHSENKIIMSDYTLNDYLNNTKDEIIAYLKDGERDLDEIRNVLIKKEDESWLYDYYSHHKSDEKYYEEIRKYYEKDLDKILKIAQYMQELDIPNYLEILAIMPVRKWDLLKKIYKKEENQDPERLKNNMIKIFGELSKIY